MSLKGHLLTMHQYTLMKRWLTGIDAVHQSTTDVQWQQLTQEALATKFAGLVLDHAKRSKRNIPPGCDHLLKQSSLRVATHNLNLHSKLETILTGFNQAGIDVMLLKGAALLGQVYDRPDLRPMSDVDLLLKARDVEAATSLLKQLGCIKGMDLVREDHFPTYYYELEFISAGPNPIRLDVHVRPFRPTRYAPLLHEDQFWEDARRVEIGQAKAVIPCAETMLIHLAAHAAFHDCSRLMWLYDVKRWCEVFGRQMDWSLVLSRAKSWHLVAPVRWAISVAESTWGPFVPTSFRDSLAGMNTSWKDRLVLWQAPRDANHPIGHLTVDLLTTPGIRFRLGYARNFLLPTGRHLAKIYPYRHIGWRSVAHLWRGGRLVWRSLLRNMQRLKVATTHQIHAST